MKKLFIVTALLLMIIASQEKQSDKVFFQKTEYHPSSKISLSKQAYYDASESFDSSFQQLKINTRILESKIK